MEFKVMRGKIVQYNGNDGSGVLSASGRQYDFTIRQWRGETAPTVNQAITVEMTGETISAISAVADDVLLREKASELKNLLGGAGGVLSAGGGKIGRDLAAALGVPLLLAYGAFILASLAFGFGSFKGSFGMGASSYTLYGTIEQLARLGKGNYTLLLFAAYLSALIPAFWKHRFAPLATLLPTLLVAVLSWHVYGLYSDFQGQFNNEIQSLNNLYGNNPLARNMIRNMPKSFGTFSDFFSFGVGFYLSLGTALAAAWFGSRKTLVALIARSRS